MAIVHTYDQLMALAPTKAEHALIDACKTGDACHLGSTCPTEPTPQTEIRADILRYLILGGCADLELHDNGVWLVGAYVTGDFDVSFATARGPTVIINCRFDARIDSVQTQFELVQFSDSHLVGWRAQGAQIKGPVLLRRMTSEAAIDLNGTDIGGQLVCEAARLTSTDGYALTAQTATIRGGVVLHPKVKPNEDTTGPAFQANGGIKLTGSRIELLYGETITLTASGGHDALSANNLTVTGDVRLGGCHAVGEVKFSGARIEGALDCEKAQFHNEHGHAFNGQRMKVDQAFIWKKVANGTGAVSLNGAHVGELEDDPTNWPKAAALYLDGFTYDRISGKVSTSPDRMNWLNNGSYFDGDFRPQPFSQYAKFLRDTGHDEDGRRVLEAREKLRRASARDQRRRSGDVLALLKNAWFSLWDVLLRIVVGYGHRPFRSLVWLAGFWTIALWLSHMAWDKGDFAPAAAVLQNSPQWRALAAQDTAQMPNPAAVWSTRQVVDGQRTGYVPGQDWETFSSFAYAADLVIPIIDLGQTDSWSPSTERGDWGRRLWRYGFFLQLAGWIVTALGAAAITGIIRRE